VPDHRPAAGVVHPLGGVDRERDDATAERFVALPGQSAVKVHDRAIPIPGGFYSGRVFFPKDGVLARTISLETERGNPRSRLRLETQLLHHDGGAWHGYTYAWNDEQTDAVLVPPQGMDRTLTVIDAKAPGGKREQRWHFPSRAECLTCHNPWAGNTLSFTPAQLNREHDYNGVRDNQLRALRHAGLIDLLHDDGTGPAVKARDLPREHLTDPYDGKADLDRRARSYLQVNCAHCHQFGAGGTADIELRHDVPLDQTKTLEVRPVQGTFGIAGAHILSPGDPYRSVLYYRMAKVGRGRMPHLGSDLVDERGLRLMHDWIRRLPIHKDDRTLLARLRDLDEPAVLAGEKAEAAGRVAGIAGEIARSRGRQQPTADDRRDAEAREQREAKARAKARAAERADAVRRLLSSTASALMLARALADGDVPASSRSQVIAAALAMPDVQVRDLFARFAKDDRRRKVLGGVIRQEEILSRKGNAARGRELFLSPALQCVKCHQVAGKGGNVGPDLSQVGKTSSRTQILESVLEPSKKIDPKYVAYSLVTTSGKTHSGLLVKRTDKEVVLRTADDKEVRVPAGKVAALVPQKQSLMPEGLLRDSTAEEAADLLEFLANLKGT
jgi:putative heme-binding domain-containing protein